MFGDMGKMMKQLSEMKAQMSKMEKELKNTIISRSDRDGLVTIELTGKLDLKSVKIDPSIQEKDPKKIEQSVSEALSAVLQEAQKVAANKLKESGSLAGLNIPGLG